jgi:hypothetical protein
VEHVPPRPQLTRLSSLVCQRPGYVCCIWKCMRFQTHCCIRKQMHFQTHVSTKSASVTVISNLLQHTRMYTRKKARSPLQWLTQLEAEARSINAVRRQPRVMEETTINAVAKKTIEMVHPPPNKEDQAIIMSVISTSTFLHQRRNTSTNRMGSAICNI